MTHPGIRLTEKEKEDLEALRFGPFSARAKIFGGTVLLGASVLVLPHVDDFVNRSEAIVDDVGDWLLQKQSTESGPRE